jgi:hypothetical protein
MTLALLAFRPWSLSAFWPLTALTIASWHLLLIEGLQFCCLLLVETVFLNHPFCAFLNPLCAVHTWSAIATLLILC